MGEDMIARQYSRMSQEDQRTFDRWLTANAVFGLIFYAGIVVLALVGARTTGPRDAGVASSTRASDVATAQRRGQTSGAVTALRRPAIRRVRPAVESSRD